MIRASGKKPATAQPTWFETLKIRLLAPGSYNFEVTSFSTANTTPSLPLNAIAVPELSTAFWAYSTWKILPSDENCDADRSYCGVVVW